MPAPSKSLHESLASKRRKASYVDLKAYPLQNRCQLWSDIFAADPGPSKPWLTMRDRTLLGQCKRSPLALAQPHFKPDPNNAGMHEKLLRDVLRKKLPSQPLLRLAIGAEMSASQVTSSRWDSVTLAQKKQAKTQLGLAITVGNSIVGDDWDPRKG